MSEDKLQTLTEIITRVLIFINRPQVEDQLIVLLLVVIIAHLLSSYLWKLLSKVLQPLLDSIQRSKKLHVNMERAIFLLRVMTFPILGLAICIPAEMILVYHDRMIGLLLQLKYIFYIMLGFELVMAVFYTTFNDSEIRHFRRSFHIPLLVVVVSLQFSSQFVDLHSVRALVVFQYFDNPVTLGALGIATLGFYFWTDAINVLYTFLFNFLVKFTQIDEGATQASLTLARYLLIALGIYYILSQLRLDSSTVAAITAGLSVGVGFALREILANFVSGILLLFERSLHPQDVIEVEGTMAVVQSLKIRATIVRTLFDEELVIPNQKFLTESFKTYTGSDKQMRISVLIKTSYMNNLRKVIDIIKAAALAHAVVLDTPAPDVWVEDQFADNAITFKLLMSIDQPMLKEKVKSEVIQTIWHAFQRNNIGLTLPGMELYLQKSPMYSGLNSNPGYN